MFRAVLITTALLLSTLAQSRLDAGIVYGTSALAELSGSRTKAQIDFGSSPVWGQTGTAEDVTWEIVNNFNGTFSYTYTFTGFGNPGTISHFTLDLSDNPESDPNIVTGATLDGQAIPLEDVEISNGNLDDQFKDPGIDSAVKFNVGSTSHDLVYSFTSNRSPVYGHFLVKGGQSNIASNLAFGDETSMNVLDYIPRPNGVAVPEPSAFLFLSAVVLLTRIRSRFAAVETH